VSAPGFELFEIEPCGTHRAFTVPEPSGHLIKFGSTRNSDEPV
jgi:hypothetical protein